MGNFVPEEKKSIFIPEVVVQDGNQTTKKKTGKPPAEIKRFKITRCR